MNLDIIFEDNHLIVLNKPAGLMTQPSGTNEDSLEKQAKAWLKEKYKKPGNVYLEAIHRLDRVSSGIVVFAKTSKALSRLVNEMREGKTEKWYLAKVFPIPKKTSGILTHYLLHQDRQSKVVDQSVPNAKYAELSYEVMKEDLLKIHLTTGRYHQIRVQLAEIGSPIRGDRKYGSKQLWNQPGIALHHFRFEISHPVTKERLVFEREANWV